MLLLFPSFPQTLQTKIDRPCIFFLELFVIKELICSSSFCMLPECSFAMATVRAKDSLDASRGDDIGVDFITLVSSLKAAFEAKGNSAGFVECRYLFFLLV